MNMGMLLRKGKKIAKVGWFSVPRCIIQIPLGNLLTKVAEVWKLSKL
jgi:hypothetical protein